MEVIAQGDRENFADFIWFIWNAGFGLDRPKPDRIFISIVKWRKSFIVFVPVHDGGLGIDVDAVADFK